MQEIQRLLIARQRGPGVPGVCQRRDDVRLGLGQCFRHAPRKNARRRAEPHPVCFERPVGSTRDRQVASREWRPIRLARSVDSGLCRRRRAQIAPAADRRRKKRRQLWIKHADSRAVGDETVQVEHQPVLHRAHFRQPGAQERPLKKLSARRSIRFDTCPRI